MVLLTVSAAVDSLRPPPCTAMPCRHAPATEQQTAFLYAELALIALGTRSIKPCVSSPAPTRRPARSTPSSTGSSSPSTWECCWASRSTCTSKRRQVVRGTSECRWRPSWHPPSSWSRKFRCTDTGGPWGAPFKWFLVAATRNPRNHLKGVEVGGGERLYEVGTTDQSAIAGATKLLHAKHYRYYLYHC